MNLLVTGAWQSAEAQLETLRGMGHDVLFQQQERDALPCDPAWVEGIICNCFFLYHAFEQFPNLRYIQLTSAGLDRVPLQTIRDRGVTIHNARGVYSAPMAEHAVWGVLTLLRHGATFAAMQAEHHWEKRRDLAELSGKTVCILGTGSVGTACAKRFRAFDCTVIGANRTVRENGAFDELYPMTEVPALLPRADVVVLTLPLTDETCGFLNADRIGLMKPGAILVNIARGALVDEKALTAALRDRLGGAVLDVFDPEPLSPDSPLWDMENVIVTPHNSFVGDGNAARLDGMIFENLRAFCHE